MSTHKPISHSVTSRSMISGYSYHTTLHQSGMTEKYSVSYTSKPDSSIREKTSEYSQCSFFKSTQMNTLMTSGKKCKQNCKLWYQCSFSGWEKLPCHWNEDKETRLSAVHKHHKPKTLHTVKRLKISELVHPAMLARGKRWYKHTLQLSNTFPQLDKWSGQSGHNKLSCKKLRMHLVPGRGKKQYVWSPNEHAERARRGGCREEPDQSRGALVSPFSTQRQKNETKERPQPSSWVLYLKSKRLQSIL